MKLSQVVIVPILLTCVSALQTAAPGATLSAQTGTIQGRTVDSRGNAVADVSVEVADTDIGALSDARGSFTLRRVPAGTHRLRVARIGYAAETTTVEVESEGARVEIVLRESPIGVEGVTVIGSQAELGEIRDRLARIPGSVSLISPQLIRNTRQANFKDVLRMTPGVWAQPRFGAADETQLSIRGSGLRNNFHLRGVNLLVNGMPYRNADGFTDFESLELLTTQNMQVYKGANALRFGGGTLGGAINLETETGHTADELNTYVQGGSFGFFKGQASSGRTFGDSNYYVSYARTDVDGFRTYSGQRRDRVNAHFGHRISEDLDLRTFYMFAYVEEDLPGALSADEFRQDREMANPGNVADRHGRDYSLHHVGVQLRSQLTPTQRLEVSPYFQYRDIVHPIFRVLDQESRDWGVEARYHNQASLGGHENRFTLGVQGALGDTDNRHFENEAGESGDLAKDQLDQAESVAVYGEDVLELGGGLSAVLGFRWDYTRREIDDFFLDDGDQSDVRTFNHFSPKIGFLYDLPSGGAQIYGNASKFFEAPLLLELNSFTVPGFIDLDAQDGWQLELGTRGSSRDWAWDVAIYDAEIDNEIININVEPFPDAPFTVPTYRNAPATRHYGLEAALAWRLPSTIFTSAQGGDQVEAEISYTLGRYEFTDDERFEGNEIPGVPEHAVNAQLTYRHPWGLTLRPSIEWIPDDYFVDSQNTVLNEGWFTVSARAEWLIPGLDAQLFVEGRNLTDKTYSAAVSVDAGNGRFFFPADGISLYSGVRWQP